MRKEQRRFRQLLKVMRAYSDIVRRGFIQRWHKLPVEIYDAETYEVIGGLLARQATLSINIANNPFVWNGHIAPVLLRTMVDAHISLAWILRSPKQRAKRFILYGLGQEKLQVEYLKAARRRLGKKDGPYDLLIQSRQDWINSQRYDFLVEVDVGAWSGLDTRKMARESGYETLYRFAYVPFSGAAHNMWQHISLYNLRTCANPMHKYHKVPAIPELPMDPDYLYRSAKYVTKSYQCVDKKYGLKCSVPLPCDWLESRLSARHKQGHSKVEKAEAAKIVPPS